MTWPEPILVVDDKDVSPTPTYYVYAIPTAALAAVGIIPTTPCGLEVAGDNDASNADLAGVVIGQTEDTTFLFSLDDATEYTFNVAFACGAACTGSSNQGDAALSFAYTPVTVTTQLSSGSGPLSGSIIDIIVMAVRARRVHSPYCTLSSQPYVRGRALRCA